MEPPKPQTPHFPFVAQAFEQLGLLSNAAVYQFAIEAVA